MAGRNPKRVPRISKETRPYRTELTPVSFLRRSAYVFPDKTAVVHGDRRYTYRQLEERANRLGIGPQGYGGDTTSFGIHILTYPCHITSLPVAVTIECHAHRHKEVTL